MNESRYYYEGNQLITEVNDYRGIITRFDFHYDQRGILSGFNYRGEQHRGTFYYLRDMMLNIIGIVDENGRRIFRVGGEFTMQYKERIWGLRNC